MALRKDLNYFLSISRQVDIIKKFDKLNHLDLTIYCIFSYIANFKDLFRHQHGSNIGKNKNV